MSLAFYGLENSLEFISDENKTFEWYQKDLKNRTLFSFEIKLFSLN